MCSAWIDSKQQQKHSVTIPTLTFNCFYLCKVTDRASRHSSATLTEVFPCFFLSCKANAELKPAKTVHGQRSSKIFVLFYVLFVCVVLCIVCSVLFYVFFVLCRSVYCLFCVVLCIVCFVLFYVFFVLCCSMYCLFCVVLCIVCFVLFYVFFVLCRSVYCLFCVVLCIVCVYMCTVLMLPGGNSIAFGKYNISYIITIPCPWLSNKPWRLTGIGSVSPPNSTWKRVVSLMSPSHDQDPKVSTE
jgi:hypothetical protein